MNLCPESAARAAMTDAEFWDHVFNRDADDRADWWLAFNTPDIWAIDCVRCGQTVEVDDAHDRERDAFCDECADEHQPDVEEVV